MRVHPTLIPSSRIIANVDGVMNAVLVKSDKTGATLYYGPGAGGDPTASAVVADVVDVARVLTADPTNRVPHLAFQPDALADTPILSMDEVETGYYLRLSVEDKPGVLAHVTGILSNKGISIQAVMQQEASTEEGVVPVVILTHTVLEKEMNAALVEIEALPEISEKVVRIRMEQLDD